MLGLVARMTSRTRRRSRRLRPRGTAPADELSHAKVVGPNPVEGRKHPVKDVVAAVIAAGPLDGQDVLRLGDDANQAPVATGVLTDGAGIRLGEVAADRTEPDFLPNFADGCGESGGVLGRGAQDVEGQPGRRLFTDSGELGELLDEAGDGRGDHRG